jgi:hypothetical protein
MQLYYASPRTDLAPGGQVLKCPHRECRLAGFGDDHLCFSTQPLAGQGEFVHTVDVPEASVEQYEYMHDFRAERARYFALPHAVVAALALTCERFEDRTGRPWNKWTVSVLDRRPVKGQPRFIGSWALVWTSREGAGTAKVYRKAPDSSFLSVEISTTVDFDPERDYIVLEQHEEFVREAGDRPKETWRLENLAGVTPKWALFPTAWQAWVFDERVTRSALDYILTHVPQAREEIDYAAHKTAKHNRARAWRAVADTVGSVLSRRLGTRVDLGKLAGHSWTAVNAMPHRIAGRLSESILTEYAPWAPPKPKPEYEDPDKSGRYCLANLYGIYPTHGPGIDHTPQERIYTGREGELANEDKRPFSERQSRTAVALAG